MVCLISTVLCVLYHNALLRGALLSPFLAVAKNLSFPCPGLFPIMFKVNPEHKISGYPVIGLAFYANLIL